MVAPDGEVVMPRWNWTERQFDFNFPVEKWPDLLERVRGTPARVETMLAGIDEALLIQTDGAGWSIKQNLGHLIDLGYLPLGRIDQILAGEKTLMGADMTNAHTNNANHNATPILDLLEKFRVERAHLVRRFEALAQSDWSKAAMHPRIQQPMRIVDIAYFDSEHDDYHLARMRYLMNSLG